MPIRFYLLPIEEFQDADLTFRLPKYVTMPRDPRGPQSIPVPPQWQYMDFGLEPTFLAALNLTAGQHATLTANADVTTVPANLDNNVGGQLGNVQAALESLHIPADAVVAGTTYRQILRGIIGIFLVAQQFHSRSGRLFPAGIDLTTTLGDLSLVVRTKLKDAAEFLGYDYAGLTLTSTLRDVLKTIANQQMPIDFLGITI